MSSKIRLQPRKFHPGKQERKPKIDVTKTRHPDQSTNFEALFSSTFTGDYAAPSTEEWDNLKTTMYSTALQAFGKMKGGQRNDWYDSNSARLDPLIASKRKALQAYKDKPSPTSLQALRSARSNVQREVRLCINEYWSDLSSNIQQAADTGNINSTFEGINKDTGPKISKTAPIKSKAGTIITDKTKQLERWVEHYSKLYSREKIVQQSVPDAIDRLPQMPVLDEPPPLEELSKATAAHSKKLTLSRSGFSLGERRRNQLLAGYTEIGQLKRIL